MEYVVDVSSEDPPVPIVSHMPSIIDTSNLQYIVHV